MPEQLIVGRERECALLAALVDGAGAQGSALVVTGMAGIGKSTLLAQTCEVAAARNMPVLATAGVAAEADLPFAGLHRLLRPVLARTGVLPPPQRRAIETAFGLVDGPAPELFLIALGVLGLLGEEASRSPLLLAVEDAHWLDRPTADVLAFVGRRLEADPMVMIAALREGYDSPLLQADLPALPLGPLTDEASEQLLARAGGALPARTRRRVLAAAEGNPLALAELGAAPLSPGLSLTRRLEDAFAARAAELPGPTRTLVTVAATASDEAPATILEAAATVDGAARSMDDLVPAIRAGLVHLDNHRLRFRHPLVRSAIYQAATEAERQAAHTALAGHAIDPDRRAWHRWAAAAGPDPAVADEVEQAGRRALRRGAITTAAVAFERAAGLLTDPGRRASLLLDAAAAVSELGDGATVNRLLREAAPLDLGPHARAQWLLLEDAFRAGPAGDPARVLELVGSASRVAALGHRDLGLDLLVAAAARCHWGDLRAEARDVMRAADRITADPDDQRMLFIQAFAATIERGAAVLHALDHTTVPEDPSALYLRGMAVCLSGAYDRAVPLLEASARRLRGQGRLRLLAQVLTMQAWAALEIGDFDVAVPAAEESRRLAVETQGPLWQIGAQVAQSAIAAIRGDEAAVRTLTADAARFALPVGAAQLLSLVEYARGQLELGRGRHAEAYEHLRRIREPGNPAQHHLVGAHTIGDFAEAAVRSGHHDEAVTHLRETEPLAAQARSPWLDVQMLLARVHVAGDDDEHVFGDALSQDLSTWPLIRARIELAHGEWLRRHRRQVESRPALRAARDAFDAMCATPWAERARRELRAAGEGSRQRTPDTLEVLTPQEFQIAQMVAQGLTNGAIAQRLYLSRRTIESHLYRVFPKLGVSSRAELVRAMQ
ncbi:ATP-binding protein [Actinoplanes solisilvae]|uniref:ATP-binding protein n=1 Tax=Actinoplanes solisilvae TaxID=2486853 RepID=UPI000FDCD88F|nr:helix-turn-helix transcriptional regulator [Actinoplanes solisilvae]